MARRAVAVIGGGCTGVLVTLPVLRETPHDVVLIEPGELGGGTAYGSAEPWHLLNSRAGAMSADPADPGDFTLGRRGHREFLPRHRYGDYLRETLAAHQAGQVTWVRSRATGLHRHGDGWLVAVDGGSSIAAGDVVLAVGNPAASHPAAVPGELRDHPAYVGDPWAPGALAAVPADGEVLLIGTGLTAVDVAISLDEHAKHSAYGRRTPIVAVSRRGLLPLTHTAVAAAPEVPALDDCAKLSDVIRTIRAAAGEAVDWRAVVDGLRPHLDRLWTALTAGEQEAFLRHLARPWECHRHRMAPQVAARVARMRDDGLLRIRPGGVGRIDLAPSGKLRVGGLGRFTAVVNCAGPGRLPEAANPLIRDLIGAGTVRIGPHRLGLDIDRRGRVVGAGGSVHRGLWLVGPLRRGTAWETTAVPEIRAQAAALAGELAAPAMAVAVAGTGAVAGGRAPSRR